MTAIATTKTAIAATTAAAAGVELTSEVNSANVDVALALGLRWAEKRLKVELGSASDSELRHCSGRFMGVRFDTFGAVRSNGGINIGINRFFGRSEVEFFVSNTNATVANGNVIWHVAKATVPLRKVRTVEQAAAMVEKLVVAAASPAGRKALAA